MNVWGKRNVWRSKCSSVDAGLRQSVGERVARTSLCAGTAALRVLPSALCALDKFPPLFSYVIPFPFFNPNVFVHYHRFLS